MCDQMQYLRQGEVQNNNETKASSTPWGKTLLNTSCKQPEVTAKPAGQETWADSPSWTGIGGVSGLILATGNPAPDYFSSLCSQLEDIASLCARKCVLNLLYWTSSNVPNRMRSAKTFKANFVSSGAQSLASTMLASQRLPRLACSSAAMLILLQPVHWSFASSVILSSMFSMFGKGL